MELDEMHWEAMSSVLNFMASHPIESTNVKFMVVRNIINSIMIHYLETINVRTKFCGNLSGKF